jgi:hypothetical protein
MMKTKLTLFVAVLAVALFGMGCASTETISDPLKNGLVAYYPFNRNSVDESGSGIHGGVNGATLSSDRHNQPNRAYNFNGRSWVELPLNKILNFGAGDFSYCVWIKTSTANDDYMDYIIADDSGGKSHRFLGLGRGAKPVFSVRDGDSNHAHSPAKDTVADSKWHQLIGIRKGRYVYLAIDGNIVSEAENVKVRSTDVNWPGNNAYVGIGARMDSASKRPFVGSLDDVRIYNRALSAEEVKALYDLEKPKTK